MKGRSKANIIALVRLMLSLFLQVDFSQCLSKKNSVSHNVNFFTLGPSVHCWKLAVVTNNLNGGIVIGTHTSILL